MGPGHLIEVGVSYERQETTLSERAEGKLAKYNSCADDLKARYGLGVVGMHAVILGSRGSISQSAVDSIKELGLGKPLAQTLQMQVIRDSLWIFRKASRQLSNRNG